MGKKTLELIKKEKKSRILQDPKLWLKYSISIWNDIEKNEEERKLKHPAVYPIALIDRLLDCYLWKEGQVFDPFLGTGTTLIAALLRGLSGAGFEITASFAEFAYKRILSYKSLFLTQKVSLVKSPEQILDIENGITVINDDSRKIEKYFKTETFDIAITSPPYWSIHRRKRTADKKQSRPYSDLSEDLGNIENYEEFLKNLQHVFLGTKKVLKPGSYFIINVMDLRVESVFIPFHADVIKICQEIGLKLDDIIIWNRSKDYNNLRTLGYPYKFIINKIHEYLLVFRK